MGNPSSAGLSGAVAPRLFDEAAAPGTIGADPLLRTRIEAAFERLGQARSAYVGPSAYRAVAAGFKRDFGIPRHQPWTAVWEWPAYRADEIVNYLEGRCVETFGGLARQA